MNTLTFQDPSLWISTMALYAIENPTKRWRMVQEYPFVSFCAFGEDDLPEEVRYFQITRGGIKRLTEARTSNGFLLLKNTGTNSLDYLCSHFSNFFSRQEMLALSFEIEEALKKNEKK